MNLDYMADEANSTKLIAAVDSDAVFQPHKVTVSFEVYSEYFAGTPK